MRTNSISKTKGTKPKNDKVETKAAAPSGERAETDHEKIARLEYEVARAHAGVFDDTRSVHDALGDLAIDLRNLSIVDPADGGLRTGDVGFALYRAAVRAEAISTLVALESERARKAAVQS